MVHGAGPLLPATAVREVPHRGLVLDSVDAAHRLLRRRTGQARRGRRLHRGGRGLSPAGRAAPMIATVTIAAVTDAGVKCLVQGDDLPFWLPRHNKAVQWSRPPEVGGS